MKKVNEIQRMDQRSWNKTLANLLPLWLFSIAVTGEGFPHLPVDGYIAFAAFGAGIVAVAFLLWKRWLAVGLIFYYLIPFSLLGTFDEITTNYKTPFIILCALLLTAGAVGYLLSRSFALRWIILVVVGAATLMAATHVANQFWNMASNFGFGMCFPDYPGCASLTGKETPWWILFLSF
jgi:hypothetical protein